MHAHIQKRKWESSSDLSKLVYFSSTHANSFQLFSLGLSFLNAQAADSRGRVVHRVEAFPACRTQPLSVACLLLSNNNVPFEFLDALNI